MINIYFYICLKAILPLMIFYLLTGERNSKENIFLLNQIYSTPLYYFILRCLNTNPKERYYIYI